MEVGALSWLALSGRYDRILKPAYRLEVETGRRVYFQGDQIKVTARATFYEGTPVPGVPLRVEGIVDGSVTTDETGTATARTTVQFDAASQGASTDRDVRSVTVNPARAERRDLRRQSARSSPSRRGRSTRPP